MRQLADLLKRFRRDERGVFAVFFALIAIVLIAAAGAVVDFTRVQQARTRAQIAIDGAALALQSKVGVSGYDATWFKTQAQNLLTERMGDSTITAVIESAVPDSGAGRLTISGYVSVPTYFVQLVGINNIRSSMLSEVTRSSSDLEVSLSIDVTGSMATVICGRRDRNCTQGDVVTDKIGDLINASNMLIDLLVSDSQAPTYSKMAIVPWSYSVNVGSLANQVRGTPTPGVSISALTWFQGTSKNIGGITNDTEGVITLTDATTDLNDNDWVYISGVKGMTQINGKIGQITSLNASKKTFKLKVNGTILCTKNTTSCSNFGTYSTSTTDLVQKCVIANCLEVVTTSSNHGIATGESVYITGTVGTSSINNAADAAWTPTILTTTTYSLPGTSPSNGIRTSGGTSYCVKYGCSHFYFTNAEGTKKRWQPNNCVTDRTANTYNDIAPSTTPLGFHYTSGGADCIGNKIVPLTANKTTLHAAIGAHDPLDGRTLVAEGSTAGHLGLAWGWYMLSPNFAYLWPSTAPAPRAYGSTNLIKAVIFMTDGVFNTPYCKGVTADDATSGAPGNADQINCNSPNGSSKSQATTLCDSIKASANKTALYVVGFDLASDTTTLDFLRSCATSVDHFYRADTGTDLVAAFRSIAQNLSDLRISK